jgi:hypothetical protein
MNWNALLCAFAPLRDFHSGLLVVAILLMNSREVTAEGTSAGPAVPEAAKVVGPDQCAKCHQAELQQWQQTPHFATFDSLHRKPRAKEIADKLGEKSIKRSPVCTQCHYTLQNQEGRDRVVAGVSCESCHGGALSWLTSHSDFGGAGITRATESPAHREKRVNESVAQGMNNPHNIYLIARQCYDCHTVPNERLVNVGGHQAGSQGFELVSWSQGMVRHNFVRTGGTANATLKPEELRVMYVVGVMTDLEYSLRAAATATEKSTFGMTSAQRAARMKKRLVEIQKAVNDPLIEPALNAVATVELRLGNNDAIIAAADAVSSAAKEFAEKADSQRLASIDSLLPPPSAYKNQPSH